MRQFILGCILLLATQTGLPTAFSQEALQSSSSSNDQPIVDRPFRRIFVPQSDLPELPLDNLRPLEIDRLPAALDRLVRRNTESIDPWLTGTQKLRSMHAVAQLVGADLLSERTRLVWNDVSAKEQGPQDHTLRERLSPWNLAIENTFDELNSSKLSRSAGSRVEQRTEADINPTTTVTNSSPSWLFDAEGRPYVQGTGRDSWIRWSLRPTTESTPNRLRFEANVPKTVEGCLLLLLPKSARIDQSSVVMQKLKDWESAVDRLGDWPDRNPTLGASVANTIENSYWALEISGQEKIAFTVELGTTSPRGQSLDVPRDWGVDRLFSKQTLQYSIHADELRILSEWEWNESARGLQPIRLELPEGMKLRSALINDRETIVDFDGNRVTIAMPETSGAIAGGQPARMRLNAEFVMPRAQLERQGSGGYLTPAIRNSNGVVLFGTSILQDQVDGRFVAVAIEHGRLESARKTSEGLHRLEYSWNLTPPSIQCFFEKQKPVGQFESMVRLSTEADRCLADVRLRMSRTNEPRSHALRIPNGWTIDPNSLSSKPQWIPGLVSVSDSGNELMIDGHRMSSAETTIDFQLQRSLENGSELELGQMPWISIDNVDIRHCLYVEPSVNNRLSFRGRTREWIVSEEELTPWQRDSLPRLGRTVVFGTRNNALPPLVAESLEESLVIPIQTKVRKLESQWRIEHRFGLSKQWREFAHIRVHLPEQYQWYYESAQRQPLVANFDHQTGDWKLQLTDLSIEQEIEDFGTIVATRTIDSLDSRIPLHKPTIRESKRVLYSLELADRLIVTDAQGKTVKRRKDSRGYTYQWVEDQTSASSELQAEVYPTIEILDSNPRGADVPFMFNTSLELYVDGYGGQVAQIASKVHFPYGSDGELKLHLPDPWRITDCFIMGRNGMIRAMVYQDSPGVTKIVANRSELDAESTLEIRMIGPKVLDQELKAKGLFGFLSMRPSQLTFRLPVIQFRELPLAIDRTCIWFPDSMKLQSSQVAHARRETTPWPVWGWAQDTWRVLFPAPKTTVKSSSPSSLEMDPAAPGPPGRWSRVILDPAVYSGEFSLSKPSGPAWTGWIAITATLLLAGAFRRWPSLMVILGIASWLGSIWLVDPWGFVCQQVFVGIILGGILYQLQTIICPETVASASSIRSDRSSTWDPRDFSEETGPGKTTRKLLGPKALSLLPLWSLIPVGIAAWALGDGRLVYSQDPSSETAAKVFDILIPITDQGEVAGTTIYVPDELLKLIEKEDREKRQRESIAMIGASKHYLRLDSRSFGFGNADQPLTHNYEMWIGESAVGRAVRIPFPSESLKLSRFSVDGTEVLSGRFSRTETELIWFPDRPGRRFVQIESQVRLRSVDVPAGGLPFGTLPGASISTGTLGSVSGEKRGGKLWEIDSDVLPVGNAILEIETDGAWLISVAASGRSISPSAGRSVVHLGNKDRIVGYFQPPSTSVNGSSLIAMPGESSASNSEFPVMNTELLLDYEQLIARTVIEYPASMAIGGEVEIESDSQWLPIGTQWADASLVDVRTGSTLDRRRYALRWNPTNPGDTESGKPSPQKRSIVTTWIPVGDAPLRSILFAESRDRRVRQGVLRYARSSGSVWTLDGISSWIPAINSKERLDWPELKDPPLTTSLRIPLSGGFGVLRRQTLSPNEQLFGSSRIHLARDRVLMTTTIKRSGLSHQNKPMIFEIPEGVRVTKVLTLSGPLEFSAWTKDMKSYFQVFVDRPAESIGELIVEFEGELPTEPNRPNWSDGFEIQPLGGWTSPQTFSLSADPAWMIQEDPNDPANSAARQGQGDQQYLTQILQDTRPLKIRRTPPNWDGALILRLPKSDSGENVKLYGAQLGNNPTPWYGLELSIPRELIASWTSKNPVTELTNLRWNHRLVAVDPVNPSTVVPDHPAVDFFLELTPESASSVDWKALEQIEINGQRPTDLILATAEPNTPIANSLRPDSRATSIDASLGQALGIADSQWIIGRLPPSGLSGDRIEPHSTTDYQQRFAVHRRLNAQHFLSEFWIDRRWDLSANGMLQWHVPEGLSCSLARVDGQSYPFVQSESRLVLYYPQLDPAANVELLFSLSSPDSGSVTQDNLPVLISSVGQGETLVQLEPSNIRADQDAMKFRYQAWMSTLDKQLQTLGISDDDQAWRNSAMQLSGLLWKSALEQAMARDFLSSDEFDRGVGLLSGLPWHDRGDYRDDLRKSMDAIRETTLSGALAIEPSPQTPKVHKEFFQPLTKSLVVLSVAPLVCLAGLLLFFAKYRTYLQLRPWWKLLLVGGTWWLVSGDLWMPGLMALVASYLVVDTYWMVSAQFRQTGIRVPR